MGSIITMRSMKESRHSHDLRGIEDAPKQILGTNNHAWYSVPTIWVTNT
jgi:hypothetical protein